METILTAEQARELAGKLILTAIEKAARRGEYEIYVPKLLTDEEIETLRSLGYEVNKKGMFGRTHITWEKE